MSRFLEADKVLVFKLYDDLTEEFYEKEFTIQEFIDTYAVDGCPQVVDAEPVIRCEDCKYMKEVSTCHYYCEFWNRAVDDCDFCFLVE